MLKINGESVAAAGMTVAEYLRETNYNPNRVAVELNGEIVPKAAGTSRVHVIPTDGTRFYKTVQVETVAPRIRTAGNAMRLDAQGNIRLT